MRRNLSTHALKRFCACFGFGSFFAAFFSPIPTYQLISANAKVVSCTLLLLLLLLRLRQLLLLLLWLAMLLKCLSFNFNSLDQATAAAAQQQQQSRPHRASPAAELHKTCCPRHHRHRCCLSLDPPRLFCVVCLDKMVFYKFL